MFRTSPRASRRLFWTLLTSGLLLALTAAAFAASSGPQPAVDPSPPTSVTAPGAADAAAAPQAGAVAPDEQPEDWGGPSSAIAIAIETQKTSTCSDCDSQQNYCTSGGQCNSYCQALVGENGFCMPACGCCVCPEIRPDGPPPEDFPDVCQPVCRCDGVSGPQGACDPGCRQVNCL